MSISLRNAIVMILSVALIAGCDQPGRRATTPKATTSPATQAGLLPSLSDDFEGTPLALFWLPGLAGSGRYEPGAVALTSERARSGKSCVRITVKEGDILQTGDDGKETERAELDSGQHPLVGRDVWYGFSVYVPEDFPIVDDRLVIAQWKQADLQGSPLVAQRFRRGRHDLTIRAQDDRHVALPKLELGRWHDMIYHIRFAAGDDGRVQVWMNGRQVADVKGPVTLAAGGDRVYNKFGLYRDRWPAPMTIYFDNYAMDAGKSNVDPARFDARP